MIDQEFYKREPSQGSGGRSSLEAEENVKLMYNFNVFLYKI